MAPKQVEALLDIKKLDRNYGFAFHTRKRQKVKKTDITFNSKCFVAFNLSYLNATFAFNKPPLALSAIFKHQNSLLRQ